MNSFKQFSKIAVLVTLWITPLLQARAYRTGITSINTTRVRIVNNTNRTFLVKNIVCNQQKVKGGIVGYQLGKMKTKNFSDTVIKPKKRKKGESIFLVDRDLPVGPYFGTAKNKPTPYEEWGMDIEDKNDPTCKFAIVVRASRGQMPNSIIGESFKASGKIMQQSLYANAIFGGGTSAALGTILLVSIPTTFAIDAIAQGVGQLLSTIGVGLVGNPPCATISKKFEYEGGLYKNLYITINPKMIKPTPGKPQTPPQARMASYYAPIWN